MRALPITNEYPPDWDAIGDRVRAEAGHRCIRCGHKYETGKHGKGEWTACDDRCTHAGPLAFIEGEEIRPIRNDDMPARNALAIAAAKKWQCGVVAQWRILTVHHFDGNKANCEWWNLLALCQRCHLSVQCRVNPDQPYWFEHSDWLKPYVAGFYAKKYLGLNLTRSEVIPRLAELLAYERLA